MSEDSTPEHTDDAKVVSPKPVPSPAALAKKVPARTSPLPKTPVASRAGAAAAASSDPSKWGRVDDNGDVFVSTPSGERQVGSWQAGDREEGLAHYGRRFDDLATEVSLLAQRLESHPAEAKKLRQAAQALATSIPTASAVGDLASLAATAESIARNSEAVEHEQAQLRTERKHEAASKKEALASEAEELGETATHWKNAGDRLRDILSEWKGIKGVDRKVDDALWKRFAAARETFNRRRGAHFADLDRNRAQAKTVKEELVAKARVLQSSTDWGPTASAFRDLMTQWKDAGRASRDADDSLWTQFKQAQDTFFQARESASAERDAEFTDNAEAKELLLKKYEDINPEADLSVARNRLQAMQKAWDEIGMVPRDRMHDLERRLKLIEAKVAQHIEAMWRRSDPEALARAAQFTERAQSFERQAAKADSAGKTKEAAKAREQAAQWNEWANAANGAVDDL